MTDVSRRGILQIGALGTALLAAAAVASPLDGARMLPEKIAPDQFRAAVKELVDTLMGRDPAAVYETCVMSKSGEPPSRPLYARSDWRG